LRSLRVLRKELKVDAEHRARKREAARKLLHLTGLVVPFSYIQAGRYLTLTALAICLAISAILEVVRLRCSRLFPFQPLFSALARPKEAKSPSGYLYFFLGSLIAAALLQPAPAVIALTSSIVGDVASTLVGSWMGRVKLLGGRRTLEGTLAGAALIATLSVMYPLPLVLAASIAFIVAEAINKDGAVDDNLLHPLLLGAAAQLCNLATGIKCL